jgi:hypothetical protein
MHRNVRPQLHVVEPTCKLHQEPRDDIPILYTVNLSALNFSLIVALSSGSRYYIISNPKGAEAVPPEDVLVIEHLGVGGRNGLIRSWTVRLKCRIENPQPRPGFGDEDLSTVCMMKRFDQGTYTRSRCFSFLPRFCVPVSIPGSVWFMTVISKVTGRGDRMVEV